MIAGNRRGNEDSVGRFVRGQHDVGVQRLSIDQGYPCPSILITLDDQVSFRVFGWEVLQVGHHMVDLNHAVGQYANASAAQRRSLSTQEGDLYRTWRIAQIVDSQVAVGVAVLHDERYA